MFGCGIPSGVLWSPRELARAIVPVTDDSVHHYRYIYTQCNTHATQYTWYNADALSAILFLLCLSAILFLLCFQCKIFNQSNLKVGHPCKKFQVSIWVRDSAQGVLRSGHSDCVTCTLNNMCFPYHWDSNSGSQSTDLLLKNRSFAQAGGAFQNGPYTSMVDRNFTNGHGIMGIVRHVHDSRTKPQKREHWYWKQLVRFSQEHPLIAIHCDSRNNETEDKNADNGRLSWKDPYTYMGDKRTVRRTRFRFSDHTSMPRRSVASSNSLFTWRGTVRKTWWSGNTTMNAHVYRVSIVC